MLGNKGSRLPEEGFLKSKADDDFIERSPVCVADCLVELGLEGLDLGASAATTALHGTLNKPQSYMALYTSTQAPCIDCPSALDTMVQLRQSIPKQDNNDTGKVRERSFSQREASPKRRRMRLSDKNMRIAMGKSKAVSKGMEQAFCCRDRKDVEIPQSLDHVVFGLQRHMDTNCSLEDLLVQNKHEDVDNLVRLLRQEQTQVADAGTYLLHASVENSASARVVGYRCTSNG